MATFFGEILPVTNRAYDDAEDDEDSTVAAENPFTVKLHPDVKTPLSVDTLIFAFGKLAVGYVESLTRDEDVVLATVDVSETGSEEEDVSQRRHHQPATVQRLTESCCVCCCSFLDPQHPTDANHLSETVLALFDGVHLVLVLNSAPMSEYFSSDDTCDEPPTLAFRQLTTRGYIGAETCARLEPPNLVKGGAAAVVTRCHVTGCPAVLLQMYSSQHLLDGEAVSAWHGHVTRLVPRLKVRSPSWKPARHRDDTQSIYM